MLLTKELKKRLPKLYSQEEVEDPMVQVLLAGANGGLWALTEYSEKAPDGYPHLAFGYVFGDDDEFGYISMDEIDDLNKGYLPGGEMVWVEQIFVPSPLSVVKEMAPTLREHLRNMLETGQKLVVKLTEIEV